MQAREWQAEWQAGMERDERGICACRQVVLIGELAELQGKHRIRRAWKAVKKALAGVAQWWRAYCAAQRFYDEQRKGRLG